MFESRCPEITEHLGGVSIMERLAGLDFNDERPIEIKICNLFAENRAVFIQNLQCKLPLNRQPRLLQPMQQSVFINLFQMSVSKVAMQLKADLTDMIAELHDVGKTIAAVLSRPPAGAPKSTRPLPEFLFCEFCASCGSTIFIAGLLVPFSLCNGVLPAPALSR
jgi:hypothetical protein